MTGDQTDKLHHYSLDEWVASFNHVYGAVDARRSSEGILLHVVEHASQIQEDLRVGRFHDAVTHLADTFCWTCGVVLKSVERYRTNASFHEQVVSKFPRRCYHCLAERCICSATTGSAIDLDLPAKNAARKANEQRRFVFREQLRTSDNEPQSLYDLEQMFVDIYSHVNFVTPLDYIIAHFQEEVGEIAECVNRLEDLAMNEARFDEELIRKKKDRWRHELDLELADIFTWTMALLLKFDYMLGSASLYLDRTVPTNEPSLTTKVRPRQSIGLTLPRILWDRYGVPGTSPNENLRLRCPRCGETPCGCATSSPG